MTELLDFVTNLFLFQNSVSILKRNFFALDSLPVVHPLESRVPSQNFSIELSLITQKSDCSFISILETLHIFYHDAIAVLFEESVIDVIGCRLAVRESNRSDFYEMLHLPEASVVLGDVLDYCHARSLFERISSKKP